MGVWDVRCEKCGISNDVVELKRADLVCPKCGGEIETIPSGKLAIVGPTETNPLVVGGSERVFTSKAQMEAYERETGHIFVSPSERKDSVLKLKERALNQIQRLGFNDFDDYKLRRDAERQDAINDERRRAAREK